MENSEFTRVTVEKTNMSEFLSDVFGGVGRSRCLNAERGTDFTRSTELFRIVLKRS